MNTPRWILILAAAAVFLHGAESLDAELQRIAQKALVSGDYNAAIKAYKSVVSRAKSNRKVAARALLGMAEAYQKIGDSQARKIYEQVLREYADQKEETAAAQARLNAGASKGTSGVILKQVWAGRRYAPYSVSPDGRYASVTDRATGDLAVRDLQSGALRRLTTTGDWFDYTGPSVISPDGTQVAYTWSVYHEQPRRYDIRVVPINGGDKVQPRIVYRGQGLITDYVEPLGWHPDGKQLLVLRWMPDRTSQIGMLSLDTGSIRVVKSTDSSRLRPALSPDGRWIAYEAPARSGNKQNDIFVVSADGSTETVLEENTVQEQSPIWSPDGRRILFLSARTGSLSLWSIPAIGGKAAGPAERVQSDVGDAFPLGMTAAGTLFLSRPGAQGNNINAAEVGPDGKVSKPPVIAIDQYVNSNGGPSLSPDGSSMAYYSRRPGNIYALIVRDLSTGQERVIPQQIRIIARFFAGPIWFPDGRSVLVFSDQDKKLSFYRVDLATGGSQLLHTVTNNSISSYRLSADGKSIFYCVQGNGESPLPPSGQLLRYDIGSEKPEVLSSGRWFITIALSPDGKQIAFLESLERANGKLPSAISIMPAGGGQPREITRNDQWGGGSRYNALNWTPDQKHIVFVREAGDRQVLWRIPAEGGPEERMGVAMSARIKSPIFSADGRRLYFGATDADSSEIWALENFLPNRTARN
jgi:Tol biopolymer transport system component